MPSPLARPRGPLRRAVERAAVVMPLLLLLLMLASAASSAKNASDDELSSTMEISTTMTTSARPLPLRRNSRRPVVLWHGMGDSCCDPRSMGAIAAAIRRELPGTRVLSLDTSFRGGGAADASSDVWSGFFGDVSSQVGRACLWLRAHPAIRDSENGEFDAVGFSQGGLFLRALVQRCGGGGGGGSGGNNDASSSVSSSSSSPPVAPLARTLITLGSPHQGVTAFPSCDPPVAALGRSEKEGEAAAEADLDAAADAAGATPAADLHAAADAAGATPAADLHAAADAAGATPAADLDPALSSPPSLFCRAAEALIQRGAFAPGVRNRVVQAQYFKPDADPGPLDLPATREYERYLELSPFLPRVNCEGREEEEEEEREERLRGGRNSSSSSSSSSGTRPLASLRRLVLFRFYEDKVVVPRDSAWFSELRRGKVVPLRQTPLFGGGGSGGGGGGDGGGKGCGGDDDPLGLRALDESGRLELRTAPGNHMRFSVEWFVEKVVRPYLGDDDDGDDEEGRGAGREEAAAEAAAEGERPEAS